MDQSSLTLFHIMPCLWWGFFWYGTLKVTLTDVNAATAAYLLAKALN
jgi:hypothetical protein